MKKDLKSWTLWKWNAADVIQEQGKDLQARFPLDTDEECARKHNGWAGSTQGDTERMSRKQYYVFYWDMAAEAFTQLQRLFTWL